MKVHLFATTIERLEEKAVKMINFSTAAKNIKNPMKAAQAVKAVTSATSLLNTLTTQTQSQVKGMTQVVALLKEGKSIK